MPNSVEKTMQVLGALSDARGRPVTLAALSETVGIHKSTLSHILKTLCEGRYVLRVSHSEGYTLGPELYRLTRYGRYGEDLISVCHPLLRLINRESGGTALIAVVRGTHKYIIDHIAGNWSYMDHDASILDDDVYRTVTGRAILAAMPLHEAMEIFDDLGAPEPKDWPSVTDRESFIAELAKIRCQRCYYECRASGKRRFHSFAAPVMAERRCIGALGLAVMEDDDFHPDREEIERWRALMLRCRREAERRLGE